jgi:outer membrane protein TolC
MGKLAVEKAEEDFKISEIGYSAGMNTNSGVIDAETALTQAKTNYIQALYDYNNNRAQLDKAMGVPVF